MTYTLSGSLQTCEEDEATLFEIRNISKNANGSEDVYGYFDGTIPFRFTYTKASNTVIIQSEYSTDVVGKQMYESFRPLIRYEGEKKIYEDEACHVGESGPSGTDAYFLPTFRKTAIAIPWFIKEIWKISEMPTIILPTDLAINP